MGTSVPALAPSPRARYGSGFTSFASDNRMAAWLHWHGVAVWNGLLALNGTIGRLGTAVT